MNLQGLHPNVHAAFKDWSERQALHVAAPYYNPFRWRTRRELFNDFRQHMEASKNVDLHVAEIAYGERPFEVASSSDLRLRSSHELWHKENLINLTVQRFPAGWQYGAYVDGDFHLTRGDWALEAIHLLQHYELVQLFSSYSDLNARQMPMSVRHSFAYSYLHSHETGAKFFQIGEEHYSATGKRNLTPGATGGAWAFRRSAFDAIGGLIDTCILGAGDWYTAFGAIGCQADGHPEAVSCGGPYEESIRRYQSREFAAIQGNIGCLDQHAVHFWHGAKVNRAYGSRWKILRDHQFDPLTDIYRDAQGLWQLTSKKPQMRAAIRRYFLARDEDAASFAAH